MSLDPSSSPELSENYRLPKDVKPTHYDLTVLTDLENLRFEGFVKISLNVMHDTSSIRLHASVLQLGNASVYSDILKINQILFNKSLDSTLEHVTYRFPQTLPRGSKAELRIGFGGDITQNMIGYYKSSWEDEEGKTSFYTLTHFQPTAARRAFPCWDEPSFKATFSITMVSREGTVNLSNMPVILEEVYKPGNDASEGDTGLIGLSSLFTISGQDKFNWKVTRFQTTPPMSTYIVAYANGDFKYLEKIVTMPLSGRSVPLRIYGTSRDIHQAQFALDMKASILPLCEKLFDVEYPLPKLDTLVAHDFDAGAMENWGLITGHTSTFLIDLENTSLFSKKMVASAQSRKVVHMWFGNITTMEWWEYLYLNEGFTIMMSEVIILDKIFPEWKLNSSFLNNYLSRALGLDAKISSHPIEVACLDASHVDQMFNFFSYSKTASVLRMLLTHIGEDLFLKGVSLYLKENLYANTVTKDLWKGIGNVTGLDISQLMDNWIRKTGFPVLTVTENPDGIHVRQDRFLGTGRAEPKDNETIWNIPLTILTTGKDGKAIVDRSAVLRTREQTFRIDTSKPYKINAGTTGMYRVLYTQERLAKIAMEAAKPEGTSVFSLDDRIGLVHDVMALAKAGLASLSDALTLVDTLKGEREYLVWSGIADNLSDLVSTWWEDPQIFDCLNSFRRALFVPLVDRLGYDYSDTESPDTSLLRTYAVGQAAVARDTSTMEELRSRFTHFMKTGDDSKIPADLQRIIFTTAVRLGGKEEYDTVVKVQEQSKTPAAKFAAIYAMCATQDPELLEQTFDFVTHKAKYHDLTLFFLGFSSNFKARRLLFQFFKDNYDTFYKQFEKNFTFEHLIETSIMGLSTEQDHAELVEFFKERDTSKYNQALAQELDNILAKATFIKHSSKDMAAWFKTTSYF